MKKFNFWSLLLWIPFGLGLTVALTECISGFEIGVFDLLRNLAPAMDIPMRALTELGSAVGVIIVTALIFIATAITRKYFFNFGLPVTITVIISRIVNITLKNILDRPRPEFKVLEASESSFPSGHSQNNMALYVAILLCLLLIATAPKWRLIFKIVFIALPLLIGITRLYFGVHYFSDVIAGWSIGAFLAILINYLYFKTYDRIKDVKDAKA